MCITVLKGIIIKHTKMNIFNKTLQIFMKRSGKKIKEYYFEVKWSSETLSASNQ